MGAQRSKPKDDMSTSAGVRTTSTPTPQPEERFIRMSVKVPASDHRALARDKVQMSEDLDGQRITDQDVMAALLSIMLESPELRKDVTAYLRKS